MAELTDEIAAVLANDNEAPRTIGDVTRDWGDPVGVDRYLARCRINTPLRVVQTVWTHVTAIRDPVGKVIDFGAGDGRFSRYGNYDKYIGYEIDSSLYSDTRLPDNSVIVNRCAFSDEITDADLCIGNPPYVRNQDLPAKWKRAVSRLLYRRTGVSISGLANAWQYFLLLALTSTQDKGTCALIIPYEWVSRPSVKALRNYISSHRWGVTVYRLPDSTFPDVLTTSSITIIDKSTESGVWRYFDKTPDGQYRSMPSPTGSQTGILPYMSGRAIPSGSPFAKRGLSPGTQKILTLTEGERVHNGLTIGDDLVPCVTTLRPLSIEVKDLDSSVFHQFYRDSGQKCWLIRTDKTPTCALQGYLESVPEAAYQTVTCLGRDTWWKFTMPSAPTLLFAQAFRGRFPKVVRNSVLARAIGGVCGIYNIKKQLSDRILTGLDGIDLRDRIVPHSYGFRKVEINQINALLTQAHNLALNHE